MNVQTQWQALRDIAVEDLLEQAGVGLPDAIQHDDAGNVSVYVWDLSDVPISMRRWTSCQGGGFNLALIARGSTTHVVLELSLVRSASNGADVRIPVACGVPGCLDTLMEAMQRLLVISPEHSLTII